MADTKRVRMRLLRDDPVPPHADGSAFRFGLQNKEEIFEGRPCPDGKLAFDFEMTVTAGSDPERPLFGGPFASGPAGERFVYLSWQRLNGRGYVNRIKARLADLDWPLVRKAQASGKVLEADMSGRGPGGGRIRVDWRLAD